jgi:hypothetical protein
VTAKLEKRRHSAGFRVTIKEVFREAHILWKIFINIMINYYVGLKAANSCKNSFFAVFVFIKEARQKMNAALF